jgi:hypothetical protein
VQTSRPGVVRRDGGAQSGWPLCSPLERRRAQDWQALPAANLASETTCAGAMTESQWQMFSSCRTLPGKSKSARRARADSEIRFGSTPSWRALTCRKWRVSMGMSSRRSRSAGRRKRYHVESVKQVFAKSPFFDALLQVLVRGGNDAHVGLYRAVTAYAVELFHRTAPATSRVCRSKGMSPISSRNRVPPSACSKRPRRMRLRTGERPAFVTEEFGLEQDPSAWPPY